MHGCERQRGRPVPGPLSIDLIVPDTSAARLSIMISLPSEAINLTGSIELAAFWEARAAFTVDCICGISPMNAMSGLPLVTPPLLSVQRRLALVANTMATTHRDYSYTSLPSVYREGYPPWAGGDERDFEVKTVAQLFTDPTRGS